MLVINVAVDLNVLGAFKEDIVMSNVDNTTIITIKRSDNRLWSIHVSQKPSKPNKLAGGVSKSTILSLGTGMGNHILLLATPCDREVPNRKQKPMMEHRLVRSPAQSAFE